MTNSTIRVTLYKPFRGFCSLLIGLFMLLALLDYHPETSRFYQFPQTASDQGNRFGSAGVYFCFYACRWLGATVWLLPIYAFWVGGLFLAGFAGHIRRKNVGCFLLTLACFLEHAESVPGCLKIVFEIHSVPSVADYC